MCPIKKGNALSLSGAKLHFYDLDYYNNNAKLDTKHRAKNAYMPLATERCSHFLNSRPPISKSLEARNEWRAFEYPDSMWQHRIFSGIHELLMMKVARMFLLSKENFFPIT